MYGFFFPPLRLPFPIPLPSIVAAYSVFLFALTFWCWGCWLLPRRWPFKRLPVTVPLNSRVWHIFVTFVTIGSIGALIDVLHYHIEMDLSVASVWLVGLGLVGLRSAIRAYKRSHHQVMREVHPERR